MCDLHLYNVCVVVVLHVHVSYLALPVTATFDPNDGGVLFNISTYTQSSPPKTFLFEAKAKATDSEFPTGNHENKATVVYYSNPTVRWKDIHYNSA